MCIRAPLPGLADGRLGEVVADGAGAQRRESDDVLAGTATDVDDDVTGLDAQQPHELGEEVPRAEPLIDIAAVGGVTGAASEVQLLGDLRTVRR
jgi:hypothetical protein